jgi:hypothetical protein
MHSRPQVMHKFPLSTAFDGIRAQAILGAKCAFAAAYERTIHISPLPLASVPPAPRTARVWTILALLPSWRLRGMQSHGLLGND